MEFISGLIIGFFGGIVPPLLILSMTNDAKAREECLYSSYELRNEFEKLSRVQRNTARTEKDDYECLMNIRNILQKISVQKTSLTFSYYPMNKLVDESLSRIRRMDTTDENPHYHIVQTGTCVLLSWGKTKRTSPEFERLKEIQWFLQRSFPLRFILWGFYLPVKLKGFLFHKKTEG
jgi:hypothetical protein